MCLLAVPVKFHPPGWVPVTRQIFLLSSLTKPVPEFKVCCNYVSFKKQFHKEGEREPVTAFNPPAFSCFQGFTLSRMPSPFFHPTKSFDFEGLVWLSVPLVSSKNVSFNHSQTIVLICLIHTSRRALTLYFNFVFTYLSSPFRLWVPKETDCLSSWHSQYLLFKDQMLNEWINDYNNPYRIQLAFTCTIGRLTDPKDRVRALFQLFLWHGIQ